MSACRRSGRQSSRDTMEGMAGSNSKKARAARAADSTKALAKVAIGTTATARFGPLGGIVAAGAVELAKHTWGTLLDGEPESRFHGRAERGQAEQIAAARTRHLRFLARAGDHSRVKVAAASQLPARRCLHFLRGVNLVNVAALYRESLNHHSEDNSSTRRRRFCAQSPTLVPPCPPMRV